MKNNVRTKVSDKVNKTKQKGKSGLFKIVFSRVFVITILLLLQIAVFFSIFYYLSDYYVWINSFFVVISILLVINIINKDENPMYLIAWIIPILCLPVFGCLLYLFVQLQIDSKLINRRLSILTDETKGYLKQDKKVLKRLENVSPQTYSLASYLTKYSGFPMNMDTSVEFFPLGEDKFDRLIEELEKAEQFIFMEYFIVSKGYMWKTILDILVRKAAQGVEVRFMYDGMCSLLLLPYKYAEHLQKIGIRSKVFSQIRPALSTYQNNRDHRKICVIDGKTAFTGGINLADEYINKIERFGHWKDTGVMLKGDGVRNFTIMFLQMWNINEKVKENYQRYVKPLANKEKQVVTSDSFITENTLNNGFVCGYGDSPLDNENVGEQVYLHMIDNATRYVHIMTPYLIIGFDMQQSIKFAAKRGVDVRILLPHIPDKKYAFLLAKTYYKDLMNAGVKIYEYTPGFVHAKELIADDTSAVVGTINMDFRSLFLHFEDAVFMYRNKEILKIENDYLNTIRRSHRVTEKDVISQKFVEKFVGRILRLFAPLM